MSNRDLILPDLGRVSPLDNYGRWTLEWQQFLRDLYDRVGSFSGESATSAAEAAFVQGAGDAVNDNSTFGGKTVGEIKDQQDELLEALQELGVIAT